MQSELAVPGFAVMEALRVSIMRVVPSMSSLAGGNHNDAGKPLGD